MQFYSARWFATISPGVNGYAPPVKSTPFHPQQTPLYVFIHSSKSVNATPPTLCATIPSPMYIPTCPYLLPEYPYTVAPTCI